MSSTRSCVLLVSTLFILCAEASLNLRSAASEELNSLRAFPSTQTIPQSSEPHGKEADVTAASANTKILKDLDWWFLARNTVMTILITGTLVVGLCVCLKFGEGKQAEHWGQWSNGSNEGDQWKWDNIEVKMQKTDVASCVEATDYQQLLKNVASKVSREKGAEDTNSGAVRSFFEKTFRLHEMSSGSSGAVLQAMPAKEAMHWLQLQPKGFQGGM